MERPERAGTDGVRTGRAALGLGAGYSLALHAAAVLGLLLVHSAPPPDVAFAVAAVDLVMMPAAPESAPPPPAPEPAPPPIAPPEPPPPTTTAVAPPQPPLPAPTPAPRVPVRRPVSQPSAPPSASVAGAPPAPAAVAAAPPAPPPHVVPVPAARLSPAWLAGVSAWLLAHRSYPEMARRLGQQGTVLVQFTVDRDGHVLEVNLARGSGTEALDQAAQALLRNARLPPFPPDMVLAQQSVTVPIRYRLE